MQLVCKHDSHVWPVETHCRHLVPSLDLIPGRRCQCGTHVIIDNDPRNDPGDIFVVVSIDSIDAAAWAAAHPAGQTW